MRSRYAGVAVAAALALLALIPIGRWERDRHVERQLEGMRRVRAVIGPLVPADATYVVALTKGDEAILTQDSHAFKDPTSEAPLRTKRAIEMRHFPRYCIWDKREPDLRQTAPDLEILIASVLIMPKLKDFAKVLLGEGKAP